MIVVSLLLILVAVLLLVLGLAGGSSVLLISSIGASLLSAVALVIGARRAAVIRRAAMGPAGSVRPGRDRFGAGLDHDDRPTLVGEPAMARAGSASPRSESYSGSPESSSPDSELPDSSSPASGSSASGSSSSGPYSSGPSSSGPSSSEPPDSVPPDSVPPGFGAPGSASPGRRRQADPAAFADDPPAQDEGLASPSAAEARAANRDDAEAALAADAAFREASATGVFDGPPDVDVDRAAEGRVAPSGDFADDLDVPLGSGFDEDRLASGAGSAREAWRREHVADAAPQAGEPLHPDGPMRPVDESSRVDAEGAAASSGRVRPDGSSPSASSGLAGESGSGRAGESGSGLAGEASTGLPGQFGSGQAEAGDAGEDDPADEPPPQRVRPADAVRVARMNTEVLVVDGRPRYHVANCPSLSGRSTEPLPAAEAVELGFSPCGLCRPVDHLVAQAARR